MNQHCKQFDLKEVLITNQSFINQIITSHIMLDDYQSDFSVSFFHL